MTKETILAVDDEPANLRMLERLFHRDYRVLTANSGGEALDILTREQVALIITDQRMPGMTGTELLRESLHAQPDAAKIIVTGYSDIESLIEAINTTRIYQYVSKPWDPTDLRLVVQEALREYRKRAEQRRLLDSVIGLVRGCPDLFAEEGPPGPDTDQASGFEHQQLFSRFVSLVRAQPHLFMSGPGGHAEPAQAGATPAG